MSRQASRRAANGRCSPDVSAVSEGDAIAVNVREAQKFCLRRSVGREQQDRKDGSGNQAGKDISSQQGNPSSRVKVKKLKDFEARLTQRSRKNVGDNTPHNSVGFKK